MVWIRIFKSLPQVAPNSMEAHITAWEIWPQNRLPPPPSHPHTHILTICLLKKKTLLSSQHAMCSTSTRWRWSPWQALRPLPRPSLRRWLPPPHLPPLLCTSRCRHKASHWQTTRESKSTYQHGIKWAFSSRMRFDPPCCSEHRWEHVATQNWYQ